MPSLLIVTAAFAPCQWVGARRPERMARHLPARGWEVCVLTVLPQYTPPVDNALHYVGPAEVLRTHAVLPRMALRSVRDRLHAGRKSAAAPANPNQRPRPTSLIARAGRLAGRWLEFPDEWIGWAPFALRAVRGRRFDAVLATVPVFSAGLIAQRLAKRCGAKLAIDYRDSWTEVVALDQDAATTRRHQNAEDMLLTQTQLVVAVTPTIGDRLHARCPVPVAVVPNAIDDTGPPAPWPTEARLAYVGSLAYGRDLAPVLQAMGQLRQTQGIAVRLTYAGGDAPLALQQAEAHGVADLLDAHGPVSQARALQLVDAARAGIVISAPGYEYAYPGKIFEILGRQRPIVAIGPADSEVVRLPQRCEVGFGHAAGDVAGLVQTLAKLAASAAPQLRGAVQFTPQATMDQLDGALRTMLAA